MRRISPFEESKGKYLKVFVLNSMVVIGFEMRQDETRSNSWRKLKFCHEPQDEVVAALWRSETSLSHNATNIRQTNRYYRYRNASPFKGERFGSCKMF
jgi:hypothetical protein